MFRRLLATSDSMLDLALRIVLAGVFFPHGAQKVLGWFQGHGLAGTMAFFTETMGIPPVLAAMAIAAEFLGPIALFVGFLARIAAFAIFVVMAVAVALVHAHVGFFMNWFGQYPAGTEGYEFHILALALALSIMVRGAGPLSIDRVLAGRKDRYGARKISF
jgi:putative oxidoreductase